MDKQANKKLAIVSKYQRVFSTPDGQDVLMDLMKTHGMLSSTFSTNDREMCLKEGERNVVLRILTLIKFNINDLKERMLANEE